MWARIERDTVQEITEVDPAGRFHPEIVWVVCGKDCQQGFRYTEGTFCKPDIVGCKQSREEINSARLRAYANPVTGSDRFFAEATRMKMCGESGWELVRDSGADRYLEIQKELAWPESE